MGRFGRRWAALLLAGLSAVSPATAHPHIFVDATADLVFDAEGRARTLHNVWTFDEAYSAFAVQGLDADGDGSIARPELQAMADDNVKELGAYGYYSSAAMDNRAIRFVDGRNAALEYKDGQVTLSFDVDLAVPLPLVDTLELGVSDPQYYIAIRFATPSSIRLVDPPGPCGVELKPPRQLSPELMAEVQALPSDVTTLPPALQAALRGSQGAILVDCGGSSSPDKVAEAKTALAAIDALAEIADRPVVADVAAPVASAGVSFWTLAAILGAATLACAGAFVWLLRRRSRPKGSLWD